MFYITISNGLLEGDHYKRMGAAVWQFMWCIDKVTKIDDDGYGWVLGGKPINLDDINLGHRVTVSRNLSELEKEGYIQLTHTPYGIIVKVCNAKKRFNTNVKPRNENAKPNKTVTVDNTVDREVDSSTSFLEAEVIPTDEDGNELRRPKKPHERKNVQATTLFREFAGLSHKYTRSRPVLNAPAYNIALFALKHLQPDQISKLFKEWFESGKPDTDLIQITQALSGNQINRFKVEHGIT